MVSAYTTEQDIVDEARKMARRVGSIEMERMLMNLAAAVEQYRSMVHRLKNRLEAAEAKCDRIKALVEKGGAR